MARIVKLTDRHRKRFEVRFFVIALIVTLWSIVSASPAKLSYSVHDIRRGKVDRKSENWANFEARLLDDRRRHGRAEFEGLTR
jgi:hypothetical protein